MGQYLEVGPPSRVKALGRLATLVLAGALPIAAVPAAAGRSVALRSGDGSIAFVSSREGNAELYVMNADGSGQRRLLRDPGYEDERPSWSPDGRQLVFDRGDIYAVRADGTGLRRLTHGKGLDPGSPAWSPGGKQIAFSDTPRTKLGSAPTVIYLMNANGTHVHQLTHGANGSVDDNPAWSPDGKTIAFDRDEGYERDLWVIPARGGRPTRLTHEAAGSSAAAPAWSPDGKSIAFSAGKTGFSEQIVVVDADGGNRRQVTRDSRRDFDPAWSPDGKKLAFSGLPPRSRTPAAELYVIGAGGGGERRLTRNGAEDASPAWQP